MIARQRPPEGPARCLRLLTETVPRALSRGLSRLRCVLRVALLHLLMLQVYILRVNFDNVLVVICRLLGHEHLFSRFITFGGLMRRHGLLL